MAVTDDDLPDNWQELDALGSFNEAIAAVAPDDGYFARRNAAKTAAKMPHPAAVQLNLFAAIDERFRENRKPRPAMFRTKSAPPRRRGRARGVTRRVS